MNDRFLRFCLGVSSILIAISVCIGVYTHAMRSWIALEHKINMDRQSILSLPSTPAPMCFPKDETSE